MRKPLTPGPPTHAHAESKFLSVFLSVISNRRTGAAPHRRGTPRLAKREVTPTGGRPWRWPWTLRARPRCSCTSLLRALIPSPAASSGRESDAADHLGRGILPSRSSGSGFFRLSAKLADSCGRPTAGLRNTNFNASSGRRLTPLQPLSQYWQGLWPTKSNGRLLQALVVSQLPSAEMAENRFSLPGAGLRGKR
jgi:hypothetical protein